VLLDFDGTAGIEGQWGFPVISLHNLGLEIGTAPHYPHAAAHNALKLLGAEVFGHAYRFRRIGAALQRQGRMINHEGHRVLVDIRASSLRLIVSDLG
jgi:hypothetical protein